MKKTLSFLSAAALTLCVSGAALAGTTRIGTNVSTTAKPVSYAYESTGGAKTFALPAVPTSSVFRVMNILPLNGTVILFDVQLLNGATWGNSTNLSTTPAARVTFPGIAGCTAAVTPTASDFVANNEFRYTITFSTGNCTVAPTIQWDAAMAAAPLTVTDNSNVLGAAGGSIGIQARTLDSTNAALELDAGGNPATWLRSVVANEAAANNLNFAIIDVGQGRQKFLPAALGGGVLDTTTIDKNGSVALGTNYSLTLGAGKGYLDRTNAAAWDANAGVTGYWTITLSGDFSSVSSTTFDNGPVGPNAPVAGTISGTSPNQTALFQFNNTDSSQAAGYGTGGTSDLWITNDGTVMATRTISATAQFYQGACSAAPCSGGILKDTFALGTFTQWMLNGTVLFAPWLNGNNAVYNARVYICAQISTAPNAPMDVRLFRVTPTGTNVSTELAKFTTTYMTTMNGCINVKGYEDLLVPAGVVASGTPYTTDNGNFAAEFTIRAINADGAANNLNFAGQIPGGTNVGAYVLIRTQ